jgi:lysophospholipase L1-like esterase
MKLISRGVPAFSSDTGSMPSAANDDNPASAWDPAALPAWIAYDLSSAPASERMRILVAWYDYKIEGYANQPPPAGAYLPADYTVEINAAPGGSSPPSSGWTAAATITGNTYNAQQYLIDLKGANWVRMNVTKSSDPTVNVDLDVYSAPAGADDDWLFMGDSITFITTPRAFSDLPDLCAKAAPGRYPAVIDAAIGGTNTGTAQAIIGDYLKSFLGRFVVLAYGTNDHAASFQMESLVTAVIAAGKVPVVPHMPWSDTMGVQTDGPLINAAIDALYVKYPQILKGPDLWQLFMNRTDLIPSGDVHPNQQGQEVLRQAWAQVIAGVTF